MIQRALNIGFQGLWVTGIANPAEMRALLDVIKFPPQGRRGVGEARILERTGERAHAGPEVLAELNDEIFVAIMVEKLEAVATIDELCALDGVDAVGLGHRDFALEAKLASFAIDEPEIVAAQQRLKDAARKHGKAWCGDASTPDALRQSVADGALLYSIGRETSAWQQTCNRVQGLKRDAGIAEAGAAG